MRARVTLRPELSGLGRIAAALALTTSVASSAAGQEIEYYHLDALGSVRVVTDQAGNVVERHDYLPFGEELCGTQPCTSVAPGQPKRFTGKERDAETGLDYFGARYYGSRIGRFTTVDPVLDQKGALVDPQSWNRYAYSRNNPLRYVDPDGRLPVPIVALTTVNPTGDPGARLDFSIGLVAGVLSLIPGLEIQANSEAQRAGQVVGAGLGLAAAGVTPRAASPKGVQANKAAGDAWSQAVGAELRATHEIAVPEITVRTQSGARTRLDWLTRDSGGAIGCVECKASATAPLTRGQAAAHPEIARSGAVVAGKGKPGVPGGTVIPPTQVQVRRPAE